MSSFVVHKKQSTTMENSPKIVDGLFICSNNKLFSLFGAPNKQSEGEIYFFWCDMNFLMTLDFLPMKLNRIITRTFFE